MGIDGFKRPTNYATELDRVIGEAYFSFVEAHESDPVAPNILKALRYFMIDALIEYNNGQQYIVDYKVVCDASNNSSDTAKLGLPIIDIFWNAGGMNVGHAACGRPVFESEQ